MTYKEFNAYKQQLFFPLTVNPDGTMNNDNFLRFSLSYIGGDVKNEIVIGKTVADAIYRSCLTIIINNLPQNYSEMETDTEGKFNKLFNKMNNLHCFKAIKEDNKIIINETINNNKYTLTYDGNGENPIDNIIDIELDDNIVTTWVKYDSYTILCILANCPYSITEYKINFDRPPLENFRMLSEYLKTCVSTIDIDIGFSSINSESEIGPLCYEDDDERSQNMIKFGKTLSYKRAILDKIAIDKKNYNFINKNNKKIFEEVKRFISRTNRTIRTLNKRTEQIKDSIRFNTKFK